MAAKLSEDCQNTAFDMQTASIVYESVTFLVRIVGGSVTTKDDSFKKVVQLIEQHPEVRNAVSRLASSWDDGDSVLDKAKTIFILLKDLLTEGILTDIIDLIISDMPWFNKALFTTQMAIYTALLIQPQINALVLISKLAVILKNAEDAVRFAQKVEHFNFLTTVY